MVLSASPHNPYIQNALTVLVFGGNSKTIAYRGGVTVKGNPFDLAAVNSGDPIVVEVAPDDESTTAAPEGQ